MATDISDVTEQLRGMSWDDYDLQMDLSIDKHALDMEAIKQPMLMAKWSNALAQAQRERDVAQQRFKIKESELTKRGFDGESPKKTGDGVKAWVRSHEEYDAAYSAYNEAEANVSYLWGARQSMDAKKAMIEMTAKLWASGYYSEVKVDTGTQDELDDKTSSTVKKQLKSSRKPKRKRKTINTGPR